MIISVDENNALSNKYPCSVEWDGIAFPSAEAAFQSTRFADRGARIRFSKLPPFKAEYEGRRARVTASGWENAKYDLMYGILKLKFLNPKFRSALLETGDAKIVISNLNHEHEWGSCACSRCRGSGRNNLGKLLMQLRSELSGK